MQNFFYYNTQITSKFTKKPLFCLEKSFYFYVNNCFKIKNRVSEIVFFRSIKKGLIKITSYLLKTFIVHKF